MLIKAITTPTTRRSRAARRRKAAPEEAGDRRRPVTLTEIDDTKNMWAIRTGPAIRQALQQVQLERPALHCRLARERSAAHYRCAGAPATGLATGFAPGNGGYGEGFLLYASTGRRLRLKHPRRR